MLAFLDARVHPNFDEWMWSACFKTVKRRNFTHKNGYPNNKSIKQHKRHRICNVIIILFIVRSLCKFVSNTAVFIYSYAATLHALQLHAPRSIHDKAVRLSVCQTRGLWQKQKKVLPRFLYHMKDNADAVNRWEFSLSVRPSVRPSVCQTHGLWQNGIKICPDF